MKVLVVVGAFNQEKALVGASSIIVKSDGSFVALAGALSFWHTCHSELEKTFCNVGTKRFY